MNVEMCDSRLRDFVGNKPEDIIAFEGTYVGTSRTCACDFLMPTEKLISMMRAFSEEIQKANSDKGE